MKKPLVYFACCLVSIAPIQSYAVDLSKGQIVQMGKKGGAYIKTAGGVAMKIGNVGRAVTPIGAVLYCVSSKKCKDRLEDAYEIACEIIAGDEDCTISRKEESECIAGFGKDKMTLSQLKSLSFVHDSDYERIEYQADPSNFRTIEYLVNNKIENLTSKPVDWSHQLYVEVPFKTKKYNKRYGFTSNSTAVYAYAFYIKCSDNEKKQLTQDDLEELAKKIADNMDDDDIKNYYNYDYGDITINNNRYDGDEINNQTNIEKQCQQYSCNEISKEIEQDINNKKYDIDDVNEQNCKMENKKYVSCNVKKSDDDDNTNNQDNTTNNTKKDDDDEPHWCKTSDLTREACEFFDWVDDEPEKPEDKKVDIEDEEEKLDKDKIDIDESCPPDEHIKLSMPWGYSTTIEFTYKPYCDFARNLKPYMTATGAIVAMYIVGSCGRRL